jgi:single-stranded-DNA-specific exonuclease
VIPLLNSATSLKGRNDSLTLLGTKDPHEAALIVGKLHKASCVWQQQMEQSFQRVLGKANEGLFNTAEGIMVIDENAAPKTLGSIASRLIRLFSKAAFVLRYVDDRYFGEARAPRGCNLVELFGQCQDLLITYGGHKQAAGFSLFPECIDDFRNRLMELLQRASPPAPSLWYLDCELPLSAIRESFCTELDRLAPFGRGNANPYFLGRNVTLPSWENRGDTLNGECTGSLDGLPCTVSRDVAGHCTIPQAPSPGRCDVIYQVLTSDGDPPHVTVRDLKKIG